MRLAEIELARGITLPQDYIDFIATRAPDVELECRSDPKDEDNTTYWRLLSENDLSQLVEMNGVGTAPTHNQLTLYVNLFREVSGRESIPGIQINVSCERVSDGFVIGEDNGDILYLDPHAEFSVWAFYHDGSYVEQVARSFSEFMQRSIEIE